MLLLLAVAGYLWPFDTKMSSDNPGTAHSRQQPSDVDAVDVIGNRTDYDVFSWENFLALNTASHAQPQDNEASWESWMEDFQVLVKTGETPPPWGSTRDIPAVCQALGSAVAPQRVLYHATKTEGVIALSNQAQAGPLIDQNGTYLRYEILMSRPFYEYITSNNLYNLAGLAAFGPINFPAGDLHSGAVGATMVKAAWKILGQGDDPSRFHVSTSFVYNRLQESCAIEQLGLVGLHITTKTQSAPQWIWSSFEHIDNAPEASRIDQQRHYSFYDPQCAATRGPQACAPNKIPATPWDSTRPGQTPSQVTRVTPVNPITAAINGKYQDLLRQENPDSVWANYMLIATQYPQNPGDPTESTGRPFPKYLANTVMETYMQGDIPMVSSSCIDCHNRANAGADAKPSDFTYILSRVTAKE